MLIAVDHGNKQIKTVHTPPFTSGLIQSDTPGFGTDALAYHKLNVRLHFTHSDTNIIFLPICIISQCHELRCCKCKFSRIHLSVKNRP